MGANMLAENKIAKARSGAMAAERTRQNGFDQEADALNTQSQNRYQDFGGQQADKTKELTDFFKSNAAPLPDSAAGAGIPTSASNIVVQERAKQLGKAKAYGDQQDAALGNLRSFGDLLSGISLNQARDAGQIGLVGGFKKGSQAILPLELQAANSKGNGLKTLGDVLGGAGQVAGFAGLSGAGPSWSDIGSWFGGGGQPLSMGGPGGFPGTSANVRIYGGA